MKKKIINGLLMFALLASSMNAIVSCKDVDDDAIIGIQGGLNQQLTLIQALQNQYDALKLTVDGLKSCSCKDSNYVTKAHADLWYLSKDSAAATYLKIEDAKNTYLTIANWNTAKALIDSLINSLENRMDSTKKVLAFHDSILASHDSIIVLHDSAISAHKVLLDTLANQVAKNSLAITDLNSKVSVIDSLAKDNKKRLDNLTTTVGNLSTTVNKLDSLANLWIVDIKNLQTKVSHLDTLVISMGLRLDTVSQKAIDAYNKAVAVETLANNTKTQLDSLCEVVANLDIPSIDGLAKETWVEHYVDSVINALNIPDISNLATKDALDSLRKDAEKAVKEVETIANQAVSDAATAQAAADNAKTAADNAKTAADNAQSYAEGVNTTVGELTNTVTTFIETTYVEKIKEVDNDLDEIKKKLDKLTQDLRSLITGIILQGTYNPVVGYGNAPIDVRSLILAAYHGYADVARQVTT